MADIEIRNIPITATAPATDDYTILDGDSNGTRKINLKGQLDLKVNNTGDETIEGIKTFTSAPIMSTEAMTDYTNKRFVTDAQQTVISNTSGINTGDGITRLGVCSTSAATVAKDITLIGVSLTDGLTLLVSMTNANTASSITFSLNSGTSYPLVDMRGNTPNFSNKAGEKVLITYDLPNNRWVLLEAEFYNAGIGMPSASYINLTLGASGSTYTAPANGYLFLEKLSNDINQEVSINAAQIGGTYLGISTISPLTNYPLRCFVPLKKNDRAQYWYTTGGTTNSFRFIYAEGSKP